MRSGLGRDLAHLSVSVSVLVLGLVVWCGFCSIMAEAQGKPPAHLGSPVVMVRYESPELVGVKAAAIIVDGPFVCPVGNEHAGGECASIRFLTRGPLDMENGDLLHCVKENGQAIECEVGGGVGYVNTGMDWRSSVWHDPTGQTPRSWHVWGEADGEE